MSNVINKTTGIYSKSVHTPDYLNNTNYIINPSQSDIDKYLKVPEVIDPDIAEKENLIEGKKRELAIEALKTENKLDANGDLIK